MRLAIKQTVLRQRAALRVKRGPQRQPRRVHRQETRCCQRSCPRFFTQAAICARHDEAARGRRVHCGTAQAWRRSIMVSGVRARASRARRQILPTLPTLNLPGFHPSANAPNALTASKVPGAHHPGQALRARAPRSRDGKAVRAKRCRIPTRAIAGRESSARANRTRTRMLRVPWRSPWNRTPRRAPGRILHPLVLPRVLPRGRLTRLRLRSRLLRERTSPVASVWRRLRTR